MPGRKPREMQSTPPQKGFYLIEWEINELIRWNGISDLALRLWLTLKGLSWQMGRCDPTDDWLADWMGGISADTVRRSRRELEGSHLLLTHSDHERRWLTPLPVTRGLRDKLPPAVAAQTDAAVTALHELIRAKIVAGRVALPPPAGGVNSIDLARSLKQQQLTHRENVVDAAVKKRLVQGEGGVGGEERPGTAALAAHLEELGAYPPTAVELARRLLARMEPDAARAYAHAQRLELIEGLPHDQPFPPRDKLIRLWVSRLRFGTRVAPDTLARAEALLQTEPAAGADPWARPRRIHPLEMAQEPGTDAPSADEGGFEEGAPPEVEVTPEPPGPVITCDCLGAPRDLTPAALWDQALSQLYGQTTRSTFESFLLDTRGIGLSDDGALVVEAASENAAQVLRVRLDKVIARVLRPLVGRDLPVIYRARG